MTDIIIYADGACKNNQGTNNIGGYGAYINVNGTIKEFYGGERNTTNNKMELTAVIIPLKFLSKLNKKYNITIYTDSNYVVKGMSEWVYGWIKNNWKNSKKEPVKNKELWLELLELSKQHNIKWEWVKGHSDNIGNIRADELANLGCDSINER